MTYLFSDNFEAGALSATWSNETAAVALVPAAAYSGNYGCRQSADGVTAGVISLADSTLPNGETYADVEFDFRQFTHGSGNSPVVTIQNRTGLDHADLFVNFTADRQFWWDLKGSDNKQAAFRLGQWYHFRVITYFGGPVWTMRVWINGHKMPAAISTGMAASDVRAIHFGGFATDPNVRDFDNIRVALSTTDPAPPEDAMPLDTDPAGGFRTRDTGAFWFGSDANPDAVVMDTDGNLACDGDLTAAAVTTTGDTAVTGDLEVTGIVSVTGGQLVLEDVAAAPDAPASGVILYSEDGVLKCVDPTDTVTQLAPPAA